MKISRRVRRGAAWLDKVEPGWESSIRPESLDLTSRRKCVLGQVFAHRECRVCFFPNGTATITRDGFSYGSLLLDDMNPSFSKWIEAKSFCKVIRYGFNVPSRQMILAWVRKDPFLRLRAEWIELLKERVSEEMACTTDLMSLVAEREKVNAHA